MMDNHVPSEFQEVLINSLEVFHEFCEKNNLTYYLTGGTLLGAVRHKGIIPWDDDIDVCMPRKDYNKLMTMQDELPKGFSLGYYPLDKSYIYSFAKFYNDSVKVKEYFNYGNKSYVNGIWIDIFPLDGTFGRKPIRNLHFNVVGKIRLLFEMRARGYEPPVDKSNYSLYILKKLIKPLVFGLLYLIPLQMIFCLMEKVASIKGIQNSSKVARIYSGYGAKASFDSDVFEEKVALDFNHRKFYCPSKYDGYLTQLYGDYMTPPKAKERKTHKIEIVSSESADH